MPVVWTVEFVFPDGTTTPIGIADRAIHPDWSGRFEFYLGSDIAILELETAAPPEASRYEIYRGSDEVTGPRVFERVGFGLPGNGNTGQISEPKDPDDPKGIRRRGTNRFEVFADSILAINSNLTPEGELDESDDIPYIVSGPQPPNGDIMLVSDFDSGMTVNDAVGRLMAVPLSDPSLIDAGTGDEEVSPTVHDSGGPLFVDGRIAGVTSFGLGQKGVPDGPDQVPLGGVTPANSSFGELAIDTRVSAFADWIDDVLPPVVVDVTIASTLGGHAPYSIPAYSSQYKGGEQVRTIPVGQVNQIRIKFSEDVIVTKANLELNGLFTDSVDFDAQSPSSFVTFGYDPATFTATWTLATAGLSFPVDQFEITLLDSVTDNDSVADALDGNWTNPEHLWDDTGQGFGSGDGTPGGSFDFRFTILPGDANRNNVVELADLSIMNGNFGLGGGFGFADGDFDGDGIVEVVGDLDALFRDNFTKVWTEWNFDFMLGDLDFDLIDVDFDDLDNFVLALQGAIAAIADDYGREQGTVIAVGDINGKNGVDFDDIDWFVILLTDDPDTLINEYLSQL